MVIDGFFEFLNVLNNSSTVLKIGQDSRGPGFIEKLRFVVSKADLGVEEGCKEGHEDETQVHL
jgi:hypothetical protein